MDKKTKAKLQKLDWEVVFYTKKVAGVVVGIVGIANKGDIYIVNVSLDDQSPRVFLEKEPQKSILDAVKYSSQSCGIDASEEKTIAKALKGKRAEDIRCCDPSCNLDRTTVVMPVAFKIEITRKHSHGYKKK